MSALTGSDWNVERGAPAAEMTLSAEFTKASIRQKIQAARDTLIVVAMQIVFRVTMFLRHLNY